MFKITDQTGAILDITPEVTFIRWSRTGAPRVCDRQEAEGVVLSDQSTFCRLVDKDGLEQYPLATVEEVSIDVYIMEMKKDACGQNEVVMQALSDAEADRELRAITEDTNTETVMQAISDLQADIAMMAAE